MLIAKNVSSADKRRKSSNTKCKKRDTGTYWKAVNIPSSSSSSHGSILSAELDGCTSGESGIRVPDPPATTKKKSSEYQRSASSSALPGKKKKKKSRTQISINCVCRCVCLSVFLLFSYPPTPSPSLVPNVPA